MGSMKHAWFEWFEGQEGELLERWLDLEDGKRRQEFEEWTMEEFSQSGM